MKDYGLWASEKEPEHLPSARAATSRERQLLWEQLVEEANAHVNNLMNNRNYDNLSARKYVREQIGVKITPWHAILSRQPNIPEGFGTLVQEALFKAQELTY